MYEKSFIYPVIILVIIAIVLSSGCIDKNNYDTSLPNNDFDVNVYVLTDTINDTDDKTIVSKTYSFAYKGKSYVASVNVPRYRLDNYNLNTYRLADGQKNLVQDEYLVDFVNQIKQQVKTDDRQVLAEVLIAFVQNSISYEKDINLHGKDEYWAYPVETLINGAGDCDCKGTLLTALLRTAGFDALILMQENHLTSIVSDVQPYNNNNCIVYVEYKGKQYYIIDGTGKYGVGYYHPESVADMNLRYSIYDETECHRYINMTLAHTLEYKKIV
ncbi:MAG: hypothetical protein PHR89_04095 [Bacilli bacterium]|nr:hypothetical protein [Bacilli bacterium]